MSTYELECAFYKKHNRLPTTEELAKLKLGLLSL